MGRGQVKRIITFSLISIFVLMILVYSAFEIRRYVTGPEIIIENPSNNFVSDKSLIKIEGKAINITEVKINDNKIYMDEEGNFSQEILLSYGFNVFKISGIDRFGRETQKILDIIYKQT